MQHRKKVLIIPGYGQLPTGNWYPQAKLLAEQMGWDARIMSVPNPAEPRIPECIAVFEEEVKALGGMDDGTVIIAHSLGCHIAAQGLMWHDHCGAVMWVAPFFRELQMPPAEAAMEIHRATKKHWMEEHRLDLRVLRHRIGRSVAVFSTDDPFVPYSNAEDFGSRGALHSQLVTHEGLRHFSSFTGYEDPKEILTQIEDLLHTAA